MHKPLIGVTAGEIYNLQYPWAAPVQGQRHTFIEAVIRGGGIPVIIPLTRDLDVIKDIADRLDGLLLSGGNDIHPDAYGEVPYKMLGDLSKLRDAVEMQLLKTALAHNIPVLGICRGMQLLNVYYGGTLYQDLASDKPGPIDHERSNKRKDEQDKAHVIKIEKDSKLHTILETTSIYTNTHHHQAVKKLGKGLRVTATAPDGIIEAIETDDQRFIIGVQAHPETLHNVLPAWDRLFVEFIATAKQSVK